MGFAPVHFHYLQSITTKRTKKTKVPNFVHFPIMCYQIDIGFEFFVTLCASTSYIVVLCLSVVCQTAAIEAGVIAFATLENFKNFLFGNSAFHFLCNGNILKYDKDILESKVEKHTI